MEINVQISNGYLVIENFFMIEKIKLDSIDNILIYHHGERYQHKIYFYLLEPIIYHCPNKTIWKKLLFRVFLFFHKERLVIDEKYHIEDLTKILLTLRETLKNVIIPDLEKSLFWETIDEGYSIPLVKLIYSKKELGLANVLRKYNKLIFNIL